MDKERQNKPYVDRFNESVTGWHQPNDLDLARMKPTYSPNGTPSKLRTLVTPPGTEPYRNAYNLRKLNDPLPSLSDAHTPANHLDTWGVDPVDYRLNQDLHSFIRQPSPLADYGLGNKSQKQKKSYIVVPRLSTLPTPPVSNDGIDSRYSLISHRVTSTHVPDSQYKYLESSSPNYRRERSESVFMRKNQAFASHFIDDFISKYIADQLVPDLLLEVLSELDQENRKAVDEKTVKFEASEYITELNKRIGVKDGDTNLFSDEWIRELDYQRPPIPLSIINTNKPLQRKLDFRDLLAESTGYTYGGDQQMSSEIHHTTTKLTNETYNNTVHNDIYHDIETETIRELSRDTAYDAQNTEKTYVSQVQLNAIEKNAQNKLLDTIFMDQLIVKYIRQKGSVVDVDDLSRFLDATVIDNLIYHYQDIKDSRSRTLDNYALRKFHLNSFMNMTMDLLLTELSASLIEDMKDLDEQERKVF
ncbi:unnamed protein product [Adineta steineri]|uniref:Uncharacterized protein n=1 Tax=Adineta steineri TaxID=433720 RepID=A0A819HZD9_9BILA|nr:unnamed protein product [Adineta steineri]CAF3911020.1 unnamed protein product [Adineta steineri]